MAKLRILERVKYFCQLVYLPRVQYFILGVIVFNALILGMETSIIINASVGYYLHILDMICLGIFIVEILMKLVSERFSFFRSGWNIFDFLVVAISLFPNTGTVSILRALRIFRVLRLVTRLPKLKVIVESVLYSLPSIGWISLLLLIIFYIFSVLVTTLFGTSFEAWFGSIGASFYTLFQILTLESWSMGIVRPVMQEFPYAYLIFIPFILITSFIVLNVFIGVIVNSMSEITVSAKAKIKQNDKNNKPDGIKELEKEVAVLKEQLTKVEDILKKLDSWSL
ncbi:MAG: ion transporter [Deferribacteraceae bacterium]|jgi:voltage-gated sodium channel|nr:ion transporter [Deferribacteraceae bacterium]